MAPDPGQERNYTVSCNLKKAIPDENHLNGIRNAVLRVNRDQRATRVPTRGVWPFLWSFLKLFSKMTTKRPEAKTENLADVLFSGQVEFAPHFTAQNIHTLTPVT